MSVNFNDPDIFTDPVRSSADLALVISETNLQPNSALPAVPVREELYAKDEYAAPVGAGYGQLKLQTTFRLGENAVWARITR